MLIHILSAVTTYTFLCSAIHVGEKLTDDEVDTLLTGVEDGQGQVSYEGNC